MNIIEMENFINEKRTVFRIIVEGNQDEEILMNFLQESLKRCCYQFEEDTLIENLAEEYKLYLKELAAA